MGLNIIGNVLDVTRAQRRREDGTTYQQTKVHVLEGVEVFPVTVQQVYEGSLPVKGELVALEISVSVYNGNVYYSTPRRDQGLETILKGSAAKAAS